MIEICHPKSACFAVILLLVFQGRVTGGSQSLTKFFAGYDKAVRPDFDQGKPSTVLADMYVEAFGNIKEANMEFLVYGYFHQRWKDTRLAGKLNRTLTLKGADIENMWLPDPYCYNARESNMMMLDTQIHSKIAINSSGDILYSKGVTFLASCNMDLRNFPLDSQSCWLKFGSYGYTTDDIIYQWSTTSVTVGNDEMAQFEYISNKLSSSVDQFSVGNFSTITVTFLFQRRMGYYAIQVYLPDVFVVALSWIVFWMDKTEMGDRMALGITTILTIMFLLGSLNGSMPKVSYAKALDWYLLVSFIFVFLSLIECMLVFILTMKCSEKTKQTKRKSNTFALSTKASSSDQSPPVNSHSNGINEMGISKLEMVNFKNETRTWSTMDNIKPGELEKIGLDGGRSLADTVDKASRVLFPTLFAVYNVVYWAAYALPD